MAWSWLPVSFTSPLMLWGLAGLLLPIVAHLWLRRLSPAVRWPSVRLLAAAQAQAQRHGARQWQDIVLLLLRCAAAGMIVIAFAQPIWGRPAKPPPPLSAVDGQQRVVLVLDGSASMQRTGDAGLSLFDRAKADVETRRRALLAGGRPVTVILAGERQRVVLGDELAGLTASDARVNLAAAVRDAAQLPTVGEVELFSDMQTSAWDGETLEQSPVPVSIHRYGKDEANVALMRPGMMPMVAIAGQDVMLTFEVINESDVERIVTVRYGGDAALEPTRVTVAARAAAQVRVRIGRVNGDAMHVTASVSDDALAADNMLTWTIVPGRSVGVHVGDLGGATVDVKRAVGMTGSGFAVTNDDDAQLSVRRGDGTGRRGIVWMTGEPANRARWTLMTGDRRPWRVFGVSGREQLQQRTFARVRTALPVGPGVRVLATWNDDGSAAVVFDQRRQIVMTNADLNERRSDWAGSPLFLPVMQEWLKLAMGEAAADGSVTPGGQADWIVRGEVADDAHLIGPDGKAVSMVLRRDGDVWTHVQADIARAGTHRLMDGAGRTLGGWCVTIDPRESDLRPTNVTSQAKAAGEHDAVNGAMDENERRPTVLWPIALAVGLALLTVEGAWVALLNRSGRQEAAL